MKVILTPICLWLFLSTCVLHLTTSQARADETWVYAVQLTASVQSSPPMITLKWVPDIYGASSYTVYRKQQHDGTWGGGTTLPGSATSFQDFQVTPGATYEYQVVKQASLGYTGYGYIFAGIEAPPIEHRGKISLIVAADSGALSGELARLVSDLTGDGWVVIRHDVSGSATPSEVKSLIVADYQADPSQLKAVFLFGRVPIFMSGTLEYDSHGKRPMPADGFYGDVDGNWNADAPPTSRPSYMPSTVELMVGRVDFQNMPGVGAPTPWPSETELLRRYLNKDHAWRQKKVAVPRRAIMANRVGDAYTMAYAASGYRNFDPLVGHGNTLEANVSDSAPDSERWITRVSQQPFLWSYACGGGQANVVGQLGTHGIYNDLYSTDLVAQDAKAVFTMFFGSHFGDWTTADNIMRSMLATPTVSLTTCIVGLPHWFFHHMSMGEPIGYSARLTMNNDTLYRNQSNALARCVMINLLGDPTLRQDVVAPPSALRGSGNNGTVSLEWSPSGEQVLGYHVYRAQNASGPFTRVTTIPVASASYTDTASFPTRMRTYMVRAVLLQANPSGTYYNLSQGVFADVDAGISEPPPPPPPPPPPVLTQVQSALSMTSGGPMLTWTSQPGTTYHVEAVVLAWNRDWVKVSGDIVATGTQATFTDTEWVWYWSRFYRVMAH